MPDPVYVNPLTANTTSSNTNPVCNNGNAVDNGSDLITLVDREDVASLEWEIHSQTAVTTTSGVLHNARENAGYQSGEESETVEVGGYIVRTMPVGPAVPYWEGPRRNGKVNPGRLRVEDCDMSLSPMVVVARADDGVPLRAGGGEAEVGKENGCVLGGGKAGVG